MWWKKKSVSVFNGKSFIVAYSSIPFAEAKKQNTYPNYYFYEANGLYWCIRVGTFEVGWGFGDNGRGYSANGSIIVGRRNVDASSLDGKGLPFVKEGVISYLYESEFINNSFEGYTVYLRDELLISIREIADKTSAKDFQSVLESELRKDPRVATLMKSNMLILKSVRVEKITENR